MKKIFRHPATAYVLATLMVLYGKLVFATCRIRVVTAVPQAFAAGPVIIGLWHQQLVMLPAIRRPTRYKLLALMSGSRDGTLMRMVGQWFGIGAVVGSSHRGGMAAARTLVQAARTGHSLSITPDGPRGPAYVAKPGATEVARMAKLPLIPCAAWTTRGKTFQSWDSLRLPYPFTTISVAYGEPLKTQTPEALQAALNTLTAQAQTAVSLATTTSKP